MRPGLEPRGRSRCRVLALTAWLVAALHHAAAPGAPLDTLLAVVDARTVAASDVALARGLGVLGFAPSTGPIARSEVERYVDVLLILEEAGGIGITVEPAEIDRAWAAAAARAGGEPALDRWLQTHAIDRAWARRLVEAGLRRERFFDERFAAFVFVDEEAIARALGPGPHDETARERARDRLTREAGERAQAEWLDAARQRATIRILVSNGASIPPPFPPP
ncbi:MAG: hypothetical protein ACREM3_27895 [Candidatus Rokuibacteriota bacterium]